MATMTERSTVRSVTYDLLRTLNLSTVFGNPEASVIAMADAFAQVTGRPARWSTCTPRRGWETRWATSWRPTTETRP